LGFIGSLAISPKTYWEAKDGPAGPSFFASIQLVPVNQEHPFAEPLEILVSIGRAKELPDPRVHVLGGPVGEVPPEGFPGEAVGDRDPPFPERVADRRQRLRRAGAELPRREVYGFEPVGDRLAAVGGPVEGLDGVVGLGEIPAEREASSDHLLVGRPSPIPGERLPRELPDAHAELPPAAHHEFVLRRPFAVPRRGDRLHGPRPYHRDGVRELPGDVEGVDDHRRVRGEHPLDGPVFVVHVGYDEFDRRHLGDRDGPEVGLQGLLLPRFDEVDRLFGDRVGDDAGVFGGALVEELELVQAYGPRHRGAGDFRERGVESLNGPGLRFVVPPPHLRERRGPVEIPPHLHLGLPGERGVLPRPVEVGGEGPPARFAFVEDPLHRRGGRLVRVVRHVDDAGVMRVHDDVVVAAAERARDLHPPFLQMPSFAVVRVGWLGVGRIVIVAVQPKIGQKRVRIHMGLLSWLSCQRKHMIGGLFMQKAPKCYWVGESADPIGFRRSFK